MRRWSWAQRARWTANLRGLGWGGPRAWGGDGDAAVVVGSAVAMDGEFAVVGLVVTSAMESAPDQSLIIALLRGSEARFIVSDRKGCGGPFACPRNVDRKEAPG